MTRKDGAIRFDRSEGIRRSLRKIGIAGHSHQSHGCILVSRTTLDVHKLRHWTRNTRWVVLGMKRLHDVGGFQMAIDVAKGLLEVVMSCVLDRKCK